jgi:hypothetical protein
VWLKLQVLLLLVVVVMLLPLDLSSREKRATVRAGWGEEESGRSGAVVKQLQQSQLPWSQHGQLDGSA